MDKEAGKRAAGEAAAKYVKDGMVVGIGSGSTANHFQVALAQRMRTEGLAITAVAPSGRSEEHAAKLGIPVIPMTKGITPDLAVDGADEIGPGLALIKGGGGALVREKLVVAAAREFIVIADESKWVPVLGAYPLSTAIFPFAWEQTVERIVAALGCEVTMRGGNDDLFVSDDGLYIADLHLKAIPDPAETNRILRMMVGVADCGLFIGMAQRALFGASDGLVREVTHSTAE